MIKLYLEFIHDILSNKILNFIFIETNLTATSYESIESLEKAYTDATSNIATLKSMGIPCYHNIDATSKINVYAYDNITYKALHRRKKNILECFLKNIHVLQ